MKILLFMLALNFNLIVSGQIPKNVKDALVKASKVFGEKKANDNYHWKKELGYNDSDTIFHLILENNLTFSFKHYIDLETTLYKNGKIDVVEVHFIVLADIFRSINFKNEAVNKLVKEFYKEAEDDCTILKKYRPEKTDMICLNFTYLNEKIDDDFDIICFLPDKKTKFEDHPCGYSQMNEDELIEMNSIYLKCLK